MRNMLNYSDWLIQFVSDKDESSIESAPSMVILKVKPLSPPRPRCHKLMLRNSPNYRCNICSIKDEAEPDWRILKSETEELQ